MVAPRKLPALRALYDRASPIGAPDPPHPDYSQDPFHMVLIRGIALPGNSSTPCGCYDRSGALCSNVANLSVCAVAPGGGSGSVALKPVLPQQSLPVSQTPICSTSQPPPPISTSHNYPVTVSSQDTNTVVRPSCSHNGFSNPRLKAYIHSLSHSCFSSSLLNL